MEGAVRCIDSSSSSSQQATKICSNKSEAGRPERPGTGTGGWWSRKEQSVLAETTATVARECVHEKEGWRRRRPTTRRGGRGGRAAILLLGTMVGPQPFHP